MKNKYVQYSSMVLALLVVHCSSSKSNTSSVDDAGDSSVGDSTTNDVSTQEVSPLPQDQNCQDVGSGWCQWNLGLTQNLYKICGVSPNKMWAVGAGGTVIEWNGASWARSNFNQNIDLYNVICLNSGSIWIMGNKGGIWEYDGFKWQDKHLVTDAAIFGIEFDSSQGKILIGDQGLIAVNDKIVSFNGTFLYHGDGKLGLSTDLRSIMGPWVAGRQGFLFDYNQLSLRSCSSSTLNCNYQYDCHPPSCANNSRVGRDSEGNYPDFQGVWSNNKEAWAIGSNGAIYKNTYVKDGSSYKWEGWKLTPSATKADLWGVWQNNPSDVWAVGSSGTILFYNGSSWQVKAIRNVRDDLHGIWASDPKNMWAVGKNGTILQYKR